VKTSPIAPGPFTPIIAAAALAAPVSGQADSVEAWIARVRSPDVAVRSIAWPQATTFGASAIKALAQVMIDADFEIARAAKRALWLIVRHTGRPGGREPRDAQKRIEISLIELLSHHAVSVRREAVWMLSEIGGAKTVAALAALLADQAVREDARCALIRIAGSKSRRVLRDALASASADFKPALAEALRQLGETITQYPSQKLTPVKQTSVQSLVLP
jgi:HEAT repeat protein